jgi:hypothetical protein
MSKKEAIIKALTQTLDNINKIDKSNFDTWFIQVYFALDLLRVQIAAIEMQPDTPKNAKYGGVIVSINSKGNPGIIKP